MSSHESATECAIYEKEEMSVLAAIVSSTVMSLLCVLGTVGNILVIVVYCIRPTRAFTRPFIVITPPNGQHISTNLGESTLSNQSPIPLAYDSSIAFQSVQRRHAPNTMQTRLILLLAVVDLLTCLLILPWDVLRSVRFVMDTSLTNQTLSPDHMNNNQWQHTGTLFTNFLAFTWTNLALTEVLRLLRNIAFACEGSILAAIAVERYVTVVGSSKSSLIGCSSRARCSSCNNLRSRRKQVCRTAESENNSQFSTTEQYSNEESCTHSDWSKVDVDQISTTQTVNNRHWSTRSENTFWCHLADRCSCPLFCPNRWFCDKRRSRQIIIWSMIVGICSSVFALELLILIFHLRRGACHLANSIREYTDKCYILLTLVSFILICYLYLRIFITVHQTDMRKSSWTTRTRSMGETRVSRPTIALPSEPNQSMNETPPRPELELTTSSELRTPFEMARVYKYVSFATGPSSHLESNAFPTTQASSSCADVRVSGDDPATTASRLTPAIKKSVKSKKHPFLRSRRTGMMLFTSTVVFYATLLPVLWVHLKWWLEDSDLDAHASKEHSGMVVHHEFYYVNNAINVFIYSLFNSRFRERLQMVCAKQVRYY